MKKLKKGTRHIFKIPFKPPNPTNNPRTSTELLHFAILLIGSIEHLHGCGHCPIIGLVHIATEKHLQVVLAEDRVSHVDIGSADPQGDICPDRVQWAEEAYPRSKCQELSLSAVSQGAGLVDITLFWSLSCSQFVVKHRK